MKNCSVQPAILVLSLLSFTPFLLSGCSDSSDRSSVPPRAAPAPEERLLTSSLRLSDNVLKRCILDQAAAQEWTYADEIETLLCVDDAIESLDGMEVFSSLQNGRLSRLELYTSVLDLSPLANIRTLIDLELRNSPATSIEPLGTLGQLEVLRLAGVVGFDGVGCTAGSFIESFSPLTQLTQLRVLHLRGCFIATNYSVIGELENLEELSIVDNLSIDELPPIRNPTKLKWLNTVGTTKIRSIAVLANFPELTHLFLEGGAVSIDHTPLATLTKLKVLRIDDSNLPDISPLENLLDLESLTLQWRELDFNPRGDISDLTPLANLKELAILRLEHQKISDLAPLVGLTKLTELSVKDNAISDMSPLSEAINLRELILDENLLTTVADLSRLSQLQSLSMNNNKLVDISALSFVTSLSILRLGNNEITDLSPLMGLDQVVSLRLDSNKILELDPLYEMAGLEQLSLYNNIFSCSERADFQEARPNVSVEWGNCRQ